MSGEGDVEELEGSELGTKEYWDSRYEMEIKNYRSHGDFGEIWFDESSQDRIINALQSKLGIAPDDPIVDIGSGNGMILIELARSGFTNLTGIDYSKQAIELAGNIAKDQGHSIRYSLINIVAEPGTEEAQDITDLGHFKVVHDKGTYDAISLCPDDTKRKRELYMENISNLLEDQGIFVITSCNWTESELVTSFKQHFVHVAAIPTPQFKFGGVVGTVVTSAVFKKIVK